jgi:hypothetical protein
MNNLEKEFVPFEIALELKQLGFNEICFGYWYTEQEEFKKIDIQLSSIGFLEGEPDYILAPTYSQCFRWFREKHNLKSWIQEHRSDTFIYEIRPHVLSDYKQGETYVYTNYEKVELACLRKLIEIVKGGNK